MNHNRKFQILLLITALGSVFSACKKEKHQTQPFEIEVHEFRVSDFGGSPQREYCGYMLVVYIDSADAKPIYFKPIDIPRDTSLIQGVRFKGKLRVHPNTYKCLDSRPDPDPGKPPYYYYPHLVDILEWQKR